MDERRQLLLAVGIVEWSGALSHLHALGEYGEVWHTVVDELDHLIQQWPGVQMMTPDEALRVVAEASTYINERPDELDELLSDE